MPIGPSSYNSDIYKPIPGLPENPLPENPQKTTKRLLPSTKDPNYQILPKDDITSAGIHPLPRSSPPKSLDNKKASIQSKPDNEEAVFVKAYPSVVSQEKKSESLPRETTFKTKSAQTEKLFKDVNFSPETSKNIGGGNWKIAYLVDTSLERFKKVKSKLKTTKTFEPESKLLKGFEKIKKIGGFIRTIISSRSRKPEKVELTQLFLIALSDNFYNNDSQKIGNLTKNIEKIADKLRFSFAKDKGLQTAYPNINEFLNTKNSITVDNFVKNPVKSGEFVGELDLFLNQPRIVAYIPQGSPEEYKKEIDTVSFVRSGIKKLRNPLKRYLTIPLTIETKEGSKRLVDRYFNLGNVRDLLDTGRLSYNEKLLVALKAAKGLSALHEANIVHGDFSARNILAHQSLDKNGEYDLEVATADWGHAIQAGSKWDNPQTPILWSAPEIIRGQQAVEKSDTWSFGIVLLELLEPTGNIRNILGDNNKSYANQLYSNGNHTKKVAEEYLKDKNIDADIKNLILRCLDEETKNRPQDDEIIAILEEKVSEISHL